MKQVTTFFLKIAVIFIGIPVLALCIFLVPELANFGSRIVSKYCFHEISHFHRYIWSGVPFYFALYQAFKLLSYIDKNKAFSELSVKALKKIKYCAITISSLYVLGLPLYYLMAEKVDPPGLIFIGMVIHFCFVGYRRFCCCSPKTFTRSD